MERLFAPADLRAMARVRRAFDPAGNLNPGKVLPAAYGRAKPAGEVVFAGEREAVFGNRSNRV